MHFRFYCIWKNGCNSDKQKIDEWHQESITYCSDKLPWRLLFCFEPIFALNDRLQLPWNVLQVQCCSRTACYFCLYAHFTLKCFRHALAVIHFNANLNWKNRMKNGVNQIHVVYPKFENGEAVVRNVKVQQNFGMYIYLPCNKLIIVLIDNAFVT